MRTTGIFIRALAIAMTLSTFFAYAQRGNSHLDAAYECLSAYNMPVLWDQSIEKMMDIQFGDEPTYQERRGEILEVYREHFGWNQVRENFALMMTEHFTKFELEELAEIYRRPVMQKSLRLMPEIMQSGSEVGQKHTPKLREELEKLLSR